jgi:hypothetical protein
MPVFYVEVYQLTAMRRVNNVLLMNKLAYCIPDLQTMLPVTTLDDSRVM